MSEWTRKRNGAFLHLTVVGRFALGTELKERFCGTKCEMDSFEAAKVVHERILKLEPEPIARKIVGYVYLQDYPDQEMIRLALGPDNLVQNLIKKAKAALQLGPTVVISPPISPSIEPTSIPAEASLQHVRFPSASPRIRALPPRLAAARYWESLVSEQQAVNNLDLEALPNYDTLPEDYRFQNQFMSLEDQMEPISSGASGFGDYCYTEAAFNNLSLRQSQNLQNALDLPVKTCHYFSKGFCKHGSNCRYFHGQSFPDNYPHVFGPSSNEFGNDDHIFSPGSLSKLEMEITELLKSRGGNPVSIASLPMLYYEKYGRTLQAEGYLTESQRHGKAGFSLTKLLARLKNSIRLIDRPHGQHAVILAEDAPKYLGTRGERNDPGPIVSNSRQIYLTFPAESTFTEEDVSNYFSTFGPVQDVRIPCQQKRMFGFVTFVSSDTVKIILAKGNPHYVCGARVLVKPYREKSKLVDRKFHERLESSMYYPSHHMDVNSELQARLLRKQLMEEHEKALEIEMRRLSNLKLARRSMANQSYFGHSMDELKVSEDHSKFPSAEQFNYLFNVLNRDPKDVDHSKHSDMNYNDLERYATVMFQEPGGLNNRLRTQGLNLPDSPFASVVASSVSAVI